MAYDDRLKDKNEVIRAYEVKIFFVSFLPICLQEIFSVSD